jgi:hypothetical protein
MTNIAERTLSTSSPFAARELLGFLAARAVCGVEASSTTRTRAR